MTCQVKMEKKPLFSGYLFIITPKLERERIMIANGVLLAGLVTGFLCSVM